MSTLINQLEQAADPAEGMATHDLPSAEWLVRLKWHGPRRTIRCLGWRTRLAKRSVDVVGAATLLVVLAPVMAIVAVLVRLTGPGPILYRQVRVGLNLRSSRGDRRGATRRGVPQSGVVACGSDAGGRRRGHAYGRPFVLHKFRTMYVNAEAAGPRFATAGDARVTPLGRFLRRSRLDELPQLWNVLRGEMSLVGPRPERPEFIRALCEEIPDYLDRLGLKPGLTGLAQVLNGYDNEIDGFRRKVALDLLYLQNCCLRNDLKILFRTVAVVLTGRGAL
jgi:lipopolysaccharide/colanic/teichoic acid biosynthesis glycosyltransferase